MEVDERQHYTLLTNRRSLQAIAALFKLTDEEIDHPNCGDWIVDCIKQVLTAQLALKSAAMRHHDTLNIENYNSDPFKDKPNPLLITLPETQSS